MILLVQIADGVINEVFKYNDPVNYLMCHIMRCEVCGALMEYEDYYTHRKVCRPEIEKTEQVAIKSVAKRRQ